MDRGDELLVESGGWSSGAADSLGQALCHVPSGSYVLGPENVPDRLSAPFYITKFTVKKCQFLEFLSATGYPYNLHDIMDQIAPDPNCPAVPMSWEDAKVYARWLRSITGDYYSLPTSEQWEIAARGREGHVYPWGNELPDGRFGTFSLDTPCIQTSPVGSNELNESPFGAMDMSGNVREWVLDDIDGEDQMHLMMGGGCIDTVDRCAAYSKLYDGPRSKRSLFAGFRLIYLTDELYRKHVG